MDDRVIDMGEYLRKKEEQAEARSTFAVWGAEGERSRFALPLWRATYLARGSRAAVAWHFMGRSDALQPFVVLDLGSDPARTELDPEMIAGIRTEEEPPAMDTAGEDTLSIYLGARDERRWYLVVTELDEPPAALASRARDDIYFLAGECAGLLFHRELHRGAT